MNDKTPYKVVKTDEKGLPAMISVCGWCLPGKTVLTLCPELGLAVSISHGICQECSRKFLRGE